ncbi:MAG: tRNA pseudouridine(38-40) synthase TruA [Calditrichia bacterium]
MNQVIRKIRMQVEYDGTRYHGWQWQKNALSVQQVLEEALINLTGEKQRISAAGRTDAGVHARGQVVHFETGSRMPLLKLEKGLNAHLPEDVVVINVEEADSRFHARFSARKRVYHYYLMQGTTALYRNFCWQVFFPFNRENLFKLAPHLQGEHDYSAFAKSAGGDNGFRCIVYESRWFPQNEFLVYRIAANRFLHGMVRTLVGTMLDVARGRFTEQEFLDIFKSGQRERAGGLAPARGLFLEQVVY